MSRPAYDAVVLAGGSARRLGGIDKVAAIVGGRPLLARVLTAVTDARLTVVVGPTRPVDVAVRWAREQPPGGGPVAAVAAGMPHVAAPLVVLLAADLPFVTAEAVRRLLAAVEGDGAVAVDADGRDQPLLSAWRSDALRAALTGLPEPAGASMLRLLGRLRFRRMPPQPAAGVPPAWLDCDTEEDLRVARELA